MKIDVVKREKYIISINPVNNRIYYVMFGFWQNPADAPYLLHDWEKVLSTVKKGFTVLADLTQCKPVGQSVKPLFEEVQRMLMTAGLKKSAELFGKSIIVELGAEGIAKHSGINKQSFKDRQQAEAWLDT